eukprot:TRINITY_DN4110_c0_g1_i1.p1 TRINITY_DN4110_c0_g1~~TRINITY_DN4110_c0_g1_i1.p1  ORF type:complete len:100 (+),score=28.65 TRINITY_DN4110_c0_g1_i1:40-300(+)
MGMSTPMAIGFGNPMFAAGFGFGSTPVGGQGFMGNPSGMGQPNQMGGQGGMMQGMGNSQMGGGMSNSAPPPIMPVGMPFNTFFNPK